MKMEKNKNTMKDIPSTDRPYEKCLKNGPESLNDYELLAVIIRTGTRGEKSIELAKRILSQLPVYDGLLSIPHLEMKDLMKMKGIGKVKAIQIKCIGELSKRIAKETLSMTDPFTIASYYMEEMRHLSNEQLRLILLNTKNKLIREEIVTVGTVNASLISTREILIKALRYEAVYMIIIHNHPSGDPTPSREDIVVTRKLKDAGQLIGIGLLDHIIIGDHRYISFREKEIL
jgi:DNA repair protein RadC